MRTDYQARLQRRLREIERQGLHRTLRLPVGVDLCSNDYLGLARHPRIVEALAKGAHDEGAGSTGSRLLRGERAAFDAIEERFAAWKGSDRSLYFSSGYLANIAVLATLGEAGDVLFCDALNHASLIDGARLSRARRVIFPHNDIAALEALLKQEPCTGQRFLVVESLYGMDGDFAPLSNYATLAEKYDTQLIVDEAHAVGIYGPQGKGLASSPLLSINTAGKALGVAGAFVAAPDYVIETLVQRARTFIFSTAAPPALAHALDASLDVLEAEPERRAQLDTLSRTLRGKLNIAGESHILPILLGENERAVAVSEALARQGFDVRAIRPPTVPEGTARLRISLNTTVTTADLERFTAALAAALENPVCAASS